MSTVTQKGQVTIPKPMRDRFGIAPGSDVDFADEEGKLVVIVKAAEPSTAARLDLPYPFPGWNWGGTTEEFMEMTRGEPET